MGDHFLPRFYLKGFTTISGSDLVHVYERGKNGVISTRIKGVAQETNLYSDEIERKLANEVEETANPILTKLRQYQAIDPDEKLILARYMIVMRQRVPKHKKWVKQKAPEVLDSTFSKLDAVLKKKMEENPTKATLYQGQRQQAQQFRMEQAEHLTQVMWLDNVPGERNQQSISVLSEMTWRFFRSEDEESFYLTCDNPVFFFEHLGIGKEDSEFSFPISKDVALWASWKEGRDGFYKASRQFVKESNRRCIRNADRFVYSPYQAEWIKKLVNKALVTITKVV